MFRPCVLVIIRLPLDLSSNYTISGYSGGCEGWWDKTSSHHPPHTKAKDSPMMANTQGRNM